MAKDVAETLRLIDAIPQQGDEMCGGSCPSFGKFEDYDLEKAEDVALWASTAEALAGERPNLPYYAMAGEDGGRYPYPTEQEREIAGCLLRRAQGKCMTYETKNE